VIPFDNVTTQITSFVTRFSGKAKEEDRQFFMTIYGDTFYRQRPYDIEKLEPVVDRFLVMAYDFHKSRGEPGPNFPFDRRSLGEGGIPYDFKEMINDFTSVSPPEKLTILFGMYGYDWTLGPQGLPLKSARAIPLNEIDAEGAITDQTSPEKHILYTDDEGYKHVLWYEDLESVDIKIKYLKEQGIGSVGYWVWGYF
jgi:spore germination protein YaaH